MDTRGCPRAADVGLSGVPIAGLAGPELFDPAAYGRDGDPHETFARLRREDPVQVAGGDYGDDPRETRTIVQMDPPRHRERRALMSPRFTPRALRGLHSDLDAITATILDELEAKSTAGECDFVEAVAAPLALAVIAHRMDLPRADWPRLFRWTNEMAGATDPQYRGPGESPTETRLRATAEVFAYFAEIVERRRHAPGDDRVSVLARARPDGLPLPEHELLSYCLLLIGGGNETTRNALSGGLLAFLEHPDQWRHLQSEPRLSASACEEVLRFTTPVIHNARTADRDCELGGRTIRGGDTLALFWPSANRDEAIFDAPDRFRIDRFPNPHLAFQIGEHICLGAHLARMEIQSALRALATRLAFVEQAGPVERLQSSSVGGVKRLPIRYRLA